MPTGRPFTARASAPLLVAATDSVGAHLAAKLLEFATDERTLTDELCDMLCIWSQMFNAPAGSQVAAVTVGTAGLPNVTFDFGLRKTTASEEAKIGADIELKLTTPAGTKTALIQAKVFDAVKNSLRYDAAKDWKKLRRQLADARAQVGDLAFLLLYVPSSLLDRSHHGFSTWEQGFQAPVPATGKNSQFGVTLIPVDALLTPNNRWRKRNKLSHVGGGQFAPVGAPLSVVLLEIVSCRRGQWRPTSVGAPSKVDRAGHSTDMVPVSFRELDISVGRPDDLSFDQFAERLREYLDRRDNERGAV